MSITAFLLLAVVFWTLARCARALGNFARDLQKIEKHNRQHMLDLADEIERVQSDAAPPPHLFGRN